MPLFSKLFMPVGMSPSLLLNTELIVFFCYWREVRSWAATRGAQKADPAMLALGSACGLGSTPPARAPSPEKQSSVAGRKLPSREGRHNLCATTREEHGRTPAG